MAARVKVGSFAKSTGGAPASQAVTGVGFTPTAIILWTAHGTTSRTFVDDSFDAIGFASDTSTERSIGGGATNAQSTSAAQARAANKVLTIVNGAGTLQAECDLTSFDSDGFTLSWSTNNGSAYLIHYIALGGDVLAKVLDWTIPTTATTKAVTGAGFAPQCLIHLSVGTTSAVPATAAGDELCMGAETDSTHGWAFTSAYKDNSAGVGTNRVQKTDKSLVYLTRTGSSFGALSAEGRVSTMDSDGFTFNLTTADGSARHVYTLCLAEAQFAVGASNKPTGAAPATQTISGLAFRPLMYLLGSSQNTAGAGIVTLARRGVGAGDGSGTQSSAAEGNDTSASVTNGVDSTTKVFTKVNNTTKAIDAEADHSSFASDGFVLSWSTNDAVATEMLYLAIGSRHATITGVAATASAVGKVPSVTTTKNPTITGVRAQATGAGVVPSITTTKFVSIAGVRAQASAVARTPVVSISRSFAAVVATASAAAIAPVIQAIKNKSITGVAATASATILVPTVQKILQILAAVAQATAAGIAPTITTDTPGGALINAPPATATGSGVAPSISATKNPTITAVPAQAMADANVVTITKLTFVTAVAATASASAGLASVSIVQDRSVTGVKAAATSSATPPSVTTIKSPTVQAVKAVALAAARPPSIVATVGSTSYTLSGPHGGASLTESAPFVVRLYPTNGIISSTVTITPNDGGAGGTFSPATVQLHAGIPGDSAEFTYTPAGDGTVTISVTNNGTLDNPAGIVYTSPMESGADVPLVLHIIGPNP